MGGATDLEFEKYCKVVQSPRTVLPTSCHLSKVENRSGREKPSSNKDQLSIEQGFKEIKFRNYRSVSCKSLPSRNVDVLDSKLLNRGSVDQSLQERRTKRPNIVEVRKKIEVSLGNDASFSFSLLDSICGSDEAGEEALKLNRSPGKTSVSNTVACSVKSPREPSFLELDNRETTFSSSMPAERDLESDNREASCSSSKLAESDLMEKFKFKSHQVIGPSNSAIVLEEKDNQALEKSVSANLVLPQSPAPSDSDCSKGSPKSRFSPIKKIFGPLTKSKSHRRLSKSKSECNAAKFSRPPSIGRNKTIRKSLLHDFFSTTSPLKVEYDGNQPLKKGNEENITPPCSPAHLQANLKVEEKHGVPYFELSLSHTEDVYVAKTWRAEDTLSWVYTFHSTKGRKNSNASGRKGLKYSNKDSPIVGQMQVSCHLCSEIKDLEGAFSNLIVTEFVLYDILHSRKSFAPEGSSVPDVTEILSCSIEGSDVSTLGFDENVNSVKVETQTNTNAYDRGSSLDFSSHYPWAPVDLHPSIETAAIVITVPVEKRESLKYKSGDTISQQVHLNFLDGSLAEQARSGVSNSINTMRVHIVTPMGNHSLPASSPEKRGPSSLLDRWRSGGGCDCGGWDIGCPLIVFSNQTTECGEECPLLKSTQPCEIFLQGAKERTPALTIRYMRRRQYTIDFHAQLSILQAFAVCVAILHTTTEDPASVDLEKNKQLLQYSPMKVLVEDEVKRLIEAVTEEENEKEEIKDDVREVTETVCQSWIMWFSFFQNCTRVKARVLSIHENEPCLGFEF